MKYELVVFDLAGTTVKDNKDVHRILQTALQKHDIAISIEDANDVMGIPKPIAIRMLLEKKYNDPRAITEEWIDEIHADFITNMVYFYETDPSVGEKDGVSETFRKLKEQGIKVGVDTGFDRLITNTILKRLRWRDNNLIDVSVTSDEVSKGRPFPDMIFRAMMQTGVTNVKKVIKVGDTASDLQEGHAAGCGVVIGITSGAFTAEELQKEKPDYLIQQIPEVLNLLK